MKNKIYALSVLMTLFYSCSNNKSTGYVSSSNSFDLSRNKAIKDSVHKDSVVKDSVAKLEESKVIDDIKFGITKIDYDKRVERFYKKSEKPYYSITKKYIGDYEYSLINGLFDNNKLYYVYVNGASINYEKYKSELLDQVQFLNLMLQKKYGKNKYGDGPPEWHKTEKGYNYLAYGWEIGKKSIEIRVSNNGIYYTCDLKIYLPDIERAVDVRENNKIIKKADSTKDIL